MSSTKSKKKNSKGNKSSSTSSVDAATSKQENLEFFKDVRRAFQTCTALMLGIALAYILYLNYLMFEEMLVPFFWALVVSIILRGPKHFLIKQLKPLKAIEKQFGAEPGWKDRLRISYLKFIATWKLYFIRLLCFYLPVTVAATKASCVTIGWGCGIPWIYITIFVIIIMLLIAIIVAFSESSSYSSWVSLLLVTSLVLGIVGFLIFFVFKAVQESSSFFTQMSAILQEKVGEPEWESTMASYGITSELIQNYTDQGRAYGESWIESQGYNVTEIKSVVAELTNATSEGFSLDSAPLQRVQNMTNIKYEDLTYEKLLSMDFWNQLSWDSIKDYLGTVTSSMESFGSFAFGTGMGLLSGLGSMLEYLNSIFANVMDFLVFVGALLFLVQADDTMVDTVFQLIPVSKTSQQRISHSIKNSLNQIFICSFLLCLSHGFASWLFFSIFGMEFAYSSGFLIGIITLFPFLSPWLIQGPALAIIYLQGGDLWTVLYYAVGLFASQWAVENYVDDMIYDQIPGSHPYFTALAVVLGVSTFGVAGVLVGPMLVVLLKTTLEIFTTHLAEQPPSAKKSANH